MSASGGQLNSSSSTEPEETGVRDMTSIRQKGRALGHQQSRLATTSEKNAWDTESPASKGPLRTTTGEAKPRAQSTQQKRLERRRGRLFEGHTRSPFRTWQAQNPAVQARSIRSAAEMFADERC